MHERRFRGDPCPIPRHELVAIGKQRLNDLCIWRFLDLAQKIPLRRAQRKSFFSCIVTMMSPFGLGELIVN